MFQIRWDTNYSSYSESELIKSSWISSVKYHVHVARWLVMAALLRRWQHTRLIFYYKSCLASGREWFKEAKRTYLGLTAKGLKNHASCGGIENDWCNMKRGRRKKSGCKKDRKRWWHTITITGWRVLCHCLFCTFFISRVQKNLLKIPLGRGDWRTNGYQSLKLTK